MAYALTQDLSLTPEEYLEGEAIAADKSEYISGQVYAMAGAGDAHVKATLNAAVLLKNHLKGTGCSTYVADMKVRIGEDEAFFYPDVMVSCDPEDQLPEHDYVKNHPKLIIEVLSPSTEDIDRGRKFALYRKLESLEEYLLIDPRKYAIELFRRHSNHEWLLLTREGIDSTITLESIDLNLSLHDLYDEIRMASS